MLWRKPTWSLPSLVQKCQKLGLARSPKRGLRFRCISDDKCLHRKIIDYRVFHLSLGITPCCLWVERALEQHGNDVWSTLAGWPPPMKPAASAAACLKSQTHRGKRPWWSHGWNKGSLAVVALCSESVCIASTAPKTSNVVLRSKLCPQGSPQDLRGWPVGWLW